MTPNRTRSLLLLALLALASPATGVGITLAGPSSGPGAEITFVIALDAQTSINGYDLTVAWDESELSFLAAADLSGLGFDSTPAGIDPAGERVAAFELLAVQALDLFSVSFLVLPGAQQDGGFDFAAFVGPANGSGLVPGAIDNPAGVGFDVVPEPGTGGLLALGLVCLTRRRRTRRTAVAAAERRS